MSGALLGSCGAAQDNPARAASPNLNQVRDYSILSMLQATQITAG